MVLEAEELLNNKSFISQLTKEDPKGILKWFTELKEGDYLSESLFSMLKTILGDTEFSREEKFNHGAWCFAAMKVPVPKYSNMYEQYLDIQNRMLYLAQCNREYKEKEFSPKRSKFAPIDVLPSLCSKLSNMLKSESSPAVKCSFLLKLSNRPIIGPFKSQKNGCVYIGQFQYGWSDGLTTFINKDGEFYYGECRGGKPHGIGFYGFKTGNTYFGQFKKGYRDGRGIQRWECGDVYDGEWKEGKMIGKTTFQWDDGREYTGEWLDGSIHGSGVMKYKNGDCYDGEWSQGNRHGKGVFKW